MTKRKSNRSQLTGRPLVDWQRLYDTPELRRQAETLAVRRDMVTLLNFVIDNKVVGTQSTGNMPLKAIRSVTAQFVNPPKLDTTIGERTYRLRTEDDVWPLYFLHVLADVGRLLNSGPAKRWKVTAAGKKFLDLPPLLQTSFLLNVWWLEVNWVIAYPFEGMGEYLPPFFNMATLGHLQQFATVGQPVSFDPFADRLIEQTGLVWGSGDIPNSRMFLRSAIRQMVINILVSFGGVTCQYREEPLGKGTISELDSFELTQCGKALLDGVALAAIN